MSEALLSVGLDVGTTSTQLVVSRLQVENRAGSFAVPKLEITGRQILYRSPVYLTPLEDRQHVDGPALRALVEREYAAAGIRREAVDTGAVIITGETSRKENARRVLAALSELAGEFVVATAGPDLESVLAAKGAGTVSRSTKTGQRLLHMDIGGGTANLALVENGRILHTGCLNVGGRLLKLTPEGTLTYVSPAVAPLAPFRVGDRPGISAMEQLCRTLAQALEMAAGLRPADALLEQLQTGEAHPWTPPDRVDGICFSGGVADCIENSHPPFAYGDFGPLLGAAIRRSSLCRGVYFLGEETIGATVIGAGCHSAQLSGSTVFIRNCRLPMKNLPVVAISCREQEERALPELLKARLEALDTPAVVALPGYEAPSYAQVQALADRLSRALTRQAYICLRHDCAKALGHCLALRLPENAPVLCLDGAVLAEGDFLDVGIPVGPAVPIVVKTMILSHGG